MNAEQPHKMKLLLLTATDEDGDEVIGPVWVNPDHIMWVEYNGKRSDIAMNSSEPFYVKNAPSDFAEYVQAPVRGKKANER